MPGSKEIRTKIKSVQNTRNERHIRNVREVYGLACVVAINHRTEDTDAEVELLTRAAARFGVKVVLAKHWADGGKGATDLAREVMALCEQPNNFQFVYPDTASLWDKVTAVATKVYGASEVVADAKVKAQIASLQAQGYGSYPVCIAKTQYSFSTDATLRGAPSGHTISIREVRLAAGAEFVVLVCGDVMTMPGLPKVPAAHAIDVDSSGRITGLF